MRPSKMLAIGSLAIGVVYYLAAVAGVLYGQPTPATDVGIVSTAGIFILFGLLGLALKDPAAPPA